MSALLAELIQVLEAIVELVAQGKDAFDRDSRQRWSIERLWIHAGNLAEAHCAEAGIVEGTAPWSELISTRHVYAHYRPDQIVPDRVWNETIEAVVRIRNAIAHLPR